MKLTELIKNMAIVVPSLFVATSVVAIALTAVMAAIVL